jgi:hypothetical protein
MTIVFSIKYNKEDIVYLKTDLDQLPRIITSVKWIDGNISYVLVSGDSESEHFEFEIRDDQDIKLKTSN